MKKAHSNKKLSLTLLLTSFLFFLAGCVGPTHRVPTGTSQAVQAEREMQQKMVLEENWKRHNRLLKVSYPILTGSSGRCGVKHKYMTGFILHHRDDYARELAPILESLGLGEHVLVRYVIPGSPADQAGMKAQDYLIAINNHSVAGKKTEVALKFLAEFLTESGYTFSFFQPPPSIPIRVMRQGQELDLNIPFIRGCGFEVGLAFSDAVNAFADGNHIIMTNGMLRFVQSDTELAIVIGHELAHNTLGHIEKTKMNVAPGKILDEWLWGGLPISIFGNMTGQTFAQEFELEADYVGLYFTARGGYDITQAANILRRMAIDNPSAVEGHYLSSHPSTPERFIAIEGAIKEIDEKKRHNQPLIPEMMSFEKDEKENVHSEDEE